MSFESLYKELSNLNERKWSAIINLADAYQKTHTTETIGDAGKLTAKSLDSFVRKYKESQNSDCAKAVENIEDDNLIERFENVFSVEEYDNLLETLYETGRIYSIWIKTNF